jgi:hypothetical protein
MAQHCLPIAFSAGSLTLASDCPSWNAQIRLLAEEIRAEINGFLGSPVVKKIRVQVVGQLPLNKLTSAQHEISRPRRSNPGNPSTGLASSDPEIARLMRFFGCKGPAGDPPKVN